MTRTIARRIERAAAEAQSGRVFVTIIPLPLVLVLAAFVILLAVFRTLSRRNKGQRQFRPRWRDDDRPHFRR